GRAGVVADELAETAHAIPRGRSRNSLENLLEEPPDSIADAPRIFPGHQARDDIPLPLEQAQLASELAPHVIEHAGHVGQTRYAGGARGRIQQRVHQRGHRVRDDIQSETEGDPRWSIARLVELLQEPVARADGDTEGAPAVGP